MNAAKAAESAGHLTGRFDRLDALRGAAVVWMVVFHFCFDLNHFGWWRQDFYGDPFWTVQRSLIVALFLGCAGLSQAVAQQQGQSAARFWRRWLQIAGCAVLVSVGSYAVFPNSFISFGVLHAIALMLLLVRFAPRLPSWAWCLIGALALSLPAVFQHGFFDSRWWNWIGFVTHKPVTEDYVPLLPWFGVMCLGLALGREVLAHRPQWVTASLPALLSPLALLGRWSLSVYMLHQPLFFALLTALVAVRS